MTNIFSTPEKVERRDRLFEIGVSVLEENGWRVERIPRSGKAGVRRITKGGKSLVAAIRTSQDRWISFARTENSRSWLTLSDVDTVVVVSVDDKHNPMFALVHIFEQPDIEARFNRAYEARVKAGHKMTAGRGMWVSLYDKEANDPVVLVGAGAGLASQEIARVPLERPSVSNIEVKGPRGSAEPLRSSSDPEQLTIPEAKRRLALTLGVPPSAIKITVEG